MLHQINASLPLSAERKDYSFGLLPQHWIIASILLGSGAEHLKAGTKHDLITELLPITALMLDQWTRMHSSVDFTKVKSALRDSSIISGMRERMMKAKVNEREFENFLDSLVGVIEYAFMTEPVRRALGFLCEQARLKVLKGSIVKVSPNGVMPSIIQAVWLADIDSKAGVTRLRSAVTKLALAPLLRIGLAAHFLTRVYWSHWNKEDRLRLLNAAEEVLKGGRGVSVNKSELIRLIEKNAAGSGE